MAVGMRSRRRLGSLSDTEAQQCWIRGGSLRQHGCIGADLVGTSAQSHRMVSVFTAGMSSSRPPHATRLERRGCVVSMPISIDSSDRSPHTRRGLRDSCYDDRKRDSSGAGPLRAGRPGHGPSRTELVTEGRVTARAALFFFGKQFHYPLHGEKARFGPEAAAGPVRDNIRPNWPMPASFSDKGVQRARLQAVMRTLTRFQKDRS